MIYYISYRSEFSVSVILKSSNNLPSLVKSPPPRNGPPEMGENSLVRLNFQVIVMSIALTADVIHNIDNMDEATECALICTAFYLCIVRLLMYSSHQEDMLYVVNMMRKDWVSSSREDRAVLAEKTMFSFRLVKYFISTVASTIVLFMFVPILEVRDVCENV